MSAPLVAEVATHAGRSVARTVRRPTLIVPNVLFPVFMLAILSSIGSQATKIPGFPTKSYVTFVIGAVLVQGASSAATVAGSLLAEDMEGGFMNRMLLTRARKSALITAQLAGVMIVGALASVFILVIGLIFGVSVKAGVGGALVLILVTLLFVLTFGALGLFFASLTGSVASVQALSFLSVSLMFMSSMLMPRNLIKHEWFETIATYNPLSYFIEATRSLLIVGWDGRALALGCGIAAGTLVLALSAAMLTLRRTLERR